MDGDIAPLPGSSRRPRKPAPRSSSTTPTRRACSAATVADRSTTSGSTGGSRSRSGRCRRPSASLGGYVAGSQALRDILVQRARPFLFSTSHPPAVAAACREAIRVMQDEPELLERLWANTRRFKGELARLGFDTGVSETPITPVMMGDPDTAGRFSQRLFELGVFAQPVVYPTVALDKARIRTIVTAAHTDEHLDRALETFATARPRARDHRRGDRAVDEPGGRTTDGAAGRSSPTVVGVSDDRRQATATCRSTATCTPPLARQRTSRSTPTRARPSSAGIAEICITDHVDFDPAAGLRLRPVRRSRARPSARPPSAGPTGASRSGSASRSPTTRGTRTRSATHLRRHPYDFVIGCVHVYADSPYTPRRAWRPGSPGRPLAEIVAPYFDEVRGDPVGPVRHDRPPGLRQALPVPHVTPADLAGAPSSTSRSCVRSSRRARRSRSTPAASARPRARPIPGGDRGPVPRARRTPRYRRLRCPSTRAFASGLAQGIVSCAGRIRRAGLPSRRGHGRRGASRTGSQPARP